ncbi:hypothetical protein [Trichocoleus sp. AS-A2]
MATKICNQSSDRLQIYLFYASNSDGYIPYKSLSGKFGNDG